MAFRRTQGPQRPCYLRRWSTQKEGHPRRRVALMSRPAELHRRRLPEGCSRNVLETSVRSTSFVERLPSDMDRDDATLPFRPLPAEHADDINVPWTQHVAGAMIRVITALVAQLVSKRFFQMLIHALLISVRSRTVSTFPMCLWVCVFGKV